jgi:hypothetical protein
VTDPTRLCGASQAVTPARNRRVVRPLGAVLLQSRRSPDLRCCSLMASPTPGANRGADAAPAPRARKRSRSPSATNAMQSKPASSHRSMASACRSASMPQEIGAVAAFWATIAGWWRMVGQVTNETSSTRSVCAASAPSTLQAYGLWWCQNSHGWKWSEIVAKSKPAASARRLLQQLVRVVELARSGCSRTRASSAVQGWPARSPRAISSSAWKRAARSRRS